MNADNEMEKYAEIENKFQQSRIIEEQINYISQQMSELKEFSKTLTVLKDSDDKEMLAPLGRGVFVKAERKAEELFVDVGAGVIVNKSVPETLKVVENQILKLEEMKYQLNGQLTGINSELEDFLKSVEGQQ